MKLKFATCWLYCARRARRSTAGNGLGHAGLPLCPRSQMSRALRWFCGPNGCIRTAPRVYGGYGVSVVVMPTACGEAATPMEFAGGVSPLVDQGRGLRPLFFFVLSEGARHVNRSRSTQGHLGSGLGAFAEPGRYLFNVWLADAYRGRSGHLGSKHPRRPPSPLSYGPQTDAVEEYHLGAFELRGRLVQSPARGSSRTILVDENSFFAWRRGLQTGGSARIGGRSSDRPRGSLRKLGLVAHLLDDIVGGDRAGARAQFVSSGGSAAVVAEVNAWRCVEGRPVLLPARASVFSSVFDAVDIGVAVGDDSVPQSAGVFKTACAAGLGCLALCCFRAPLRDPACFASGWAGACELLPGNSEHSAEDTHDPAD